MAEASGSQEISRSADTAPVPSCADGISGYVAALRTLKVWCGNPSLQAMARRSKIPRSTLADALDPDRRTLPRLQVVTAIIAACGLADNDIACWQRVWRELQQAHIVVEPAADGWIGRNFLPGEIADFTGRTEVTTAVVTALRNAADRKVVAISAIDGMAGVGKTTLAVHIIHLLATDYPDGQFFLDLHGHTPGRDPLEPGAALHRLLAQLGVDASQAPQEVEDRAALWRSATAGRRAVVLLDNAADVEQVRPLLPGAPCLVLVTSRRRLVGLEGADIVSMEVMPETDAIALFERIVGTDRTCTVR